VNSTSSRSRSRRDRSLVVLVEQVLEDLPHPGDSCRGGLAALAESSFIFEIG
jgi:hypothetical protein